MSERKVLTKYYPPDFDPSKITRTRAPRDAAGTPKQMTVRLMAPFSMRCAVCGEYIYKGRKFNARKETTEERYYNIPIYRFYIKCTRCAAELTFKTDPKHMDYTAEKNMKRNFEPWREAKLAEETDEERLDRLEREEAERDAMQELENKTVDAKTEMAIADALDEIRTRNARMERADKDETAVAGPAVGDPALELREQQEREDAEAARKAFAQAARGLDESITVEDEEVEEEEAIPKPVPKKDTMKEASSAMAPPAPPNKRVLKKKKDLGAALGIKKKQALV